MSIGPERCKLKTCSQGSHSSPRAATLRHRVRKGEYEPCLPGECGSVRATEKSLWELADKMDSRRADPEREELPRKKQLSQKGGLTAGEDQVKRTHPEKDSL